MTRVTLGGVTGALLVLSIVSSWNSPASCLKAAEPAAVSADQIQKLIARLGEEDFETREKATQRLIAIGKAALSALNEASRSPDAEIRTRARNIVQEIHKSLTYVIESLQDSDIKGRRQALETIEHQLLTNKALVAPLLQAMNDKDEVVREGAITALIRIDAKAAALAKLLPAKADGGGKYQNLLRRIKVPQDKQNYALFHDYGFFEGDSWAGYNNLPKGYWVYVYPHWYIWEEPKAAK